MRVIVQAIEDVQLVRSVVLLRNLRGGSSQQ